MTKQLSFIGIDGCKGKWVAVCITESRFEVKKYDSIAEICTRYNDADRYLIDMPIGLVEKEIDVRPDAIVRKMLGPKGSSIFGVPCRQAVYAESKAAAREKNIAVLGKSLSEQTLGIAHAIRQVDEFLQGNTGWKDRLLESHPELCFMKLNGNRPVLEHKMSAEGRDIRMSILRGYYPLADEVVARYLAEVPSRKKTDDVVDALCLAVMGMVMMAKSIKSAPESPMRDSTGLLMQMVYAE
ncbi:MAG: 7 8-dihydro-8-oxoguanine triphosphatase [Bacillota bacterium]|nr:MAG: 7 8-dihydro-8-oxoguanine triphosphatase [Bacillota bacterium]MBS3949377.1 DUF429 domain-containing protein [Peptococcaceae bacterium]